MDEPNTLTEQETESINKSGFEGDAGAYQSPDALELDSLRQIKSSPIVMDDSEAVEQTTTNTTKLNDITEAQRLANEAQTEAEGIKDTIDSMSHEEKARINKDQAIKDAEAKGGLTRDEAMEIFGTDHTGVKLDEASGLYIADASAIARYEAEMLASVEIANGSIDDVNYDYYDDRSVVVGEEYNALAESIRKSFEAKKTAMKDVNKRGLAQIQQIGFRLGTQKFTPLTATNVISAEERAGISRLAELDAQMQSLILDAKRAKDDEQFELLHAKMTKIEDAQARRKEILAENQATLSKQMQEFEEEQQRQENEYDVTSLIQAGITNPVEIANALKGRVDFATILDITDSYKDQEKTMQDTINSALQSALIGEEAFELISGASDLSLWQKEMIAFDVLRGEAKDEYYWDRNMDEQTLNKMYFDMANADRKFQLDMDKYRDGRAEAMAKAKAEGKEEEEQFRQDTLQSFEVFKVANELLNTENWNNYTGVGSNLMLSGATAGTKRYDYQEKVDRLKNLLTVENLDLMSGVLSETDIQILQSAGTTLKVTLSDDAYKAEIKRIIGKVQKAVDDGREAGLISDRTYYKTIGRDKAWIQSAVATGQIKSDISLEGVDDDIKYYFNN